jgi:murein DD-endopeptidase MepM/ murein hydrolase activator NlpD
MANTVHVSSPSGVRVRERPSRNSKELFRMVTESLGVCSDVKPDADGEASNGQVYKWFLVTFTDGRQGWLRDDLIDLEGDFTAFGYGTYAARTPAFSALAPKPAQPGQPGQPGAKPVVFSGCDASVRRDVDGARVRSIPSIQGERITTLPSNTAVLVQGIEPGQDGSPLRWLKVTVDGRNGYIREDLLSFSAGCAPLGVAIESASAALRRGGSAGAPVSGRFKSPIRAKYKVTQEFGEPMTDTSHRGMDLFIKVGTPVVASGNGIVAWVTPCLKCTEATPNFRAAGIQGWDPKAIRDLEWGWGFGNHVVVRYSFGDVPGDMQNAMNSQGLGGGFVYIIYAHLSQIGTEAKASVGDGTLLGLSGDTGNSSGPHLHLEVRASLKNNEVSTSRRPVFNPRLTFQI